MTQIIEWLNQHNINVVNAISTLAILLLASITIPTLNRFLKQWLTCKAAYTLQIKAIL